MTNRITRTEKYESAWHSLIDFILWNFRFMCVCTHTRMCKYSESRRKTYFLPWVAVNEVGSSQVKAERWSLMGIVDTRRIRCSLPFQKRQTWIDTQHGISGLLRSKDWGKRKEVLTDWHKLRRTGHMWNDCWRTKRMERGEKAISQGGNKVAQTCKHTRGIFGQKKAI